MPATPGLKNTENTQFGRTSNDSGNRDPGAPGPYAPNIGLEPLLDSQGRIIVRIADKNGFVDNGGSTSKTTSGGYVETFLPFPTTPITLYLLTGFNNAVAVRYFLLFSSPIIPAPGAVPDYSMIVSSSTNFSYQPNRPFAFTPSGLAIVSSLTGDIYTPSGTLTDMWINLEYTLP